MAVWLVLPDYVKVPPAIQPGHGKKRAQRVYWWIVLVAGGIAWLLAAGLVGSLYALHRPIFAHKSVAVGDPVRLAALRAVLSAPQLTPHTSKQGTETEVVKEEQSLPRPAGKSAREQTQVAVKAGLPASELPLENETPNWEKYGTQVAFLSNPVDAARQAIKERKLLFVLHLSGNFEDQQFT